MAENNTNTEQAGTKPEIEEITIKFAKGLVGEPFTSKKGGELVEVKIPNKDENDHSPWASFVLGVKQVHEDKFGGKGLWAKLPKDGHTTISKNICITTDDGSKVWNTQKTVVTNLQLKDMVEFYKTRDHGESALGKLEASKKAVAMTPKPPIEEEMPFR